MRLAQHEHMVHALASDRSDQSFRKAVLPRRAWDDGPVTDPVASENLRFVSWRKTTDAVQTIITKFFNGVVPDRFELHAHELVAHQGQFAAHSQENCNGLALALLDVVKNTGPIS